MRKFVACVITCFLAMGIAFTGMAANLKCELRVDTVSAYPGEEVVVPVILEENPGFTNFAIAIDYPEEALELLSVNTAEEQNSYLCGEMVSVNIDWKGENGNSYGFITGASAEEISGTGILFTATFQVKDSFSEMAEVNLQVKELRSNEADFFLFENIETNVTSGGVCLMTETPEVTETPEISETPGVTTAPGEPESVKEVFDDVYQDWYTSYVQYVYEQGLMTGIKGTKHFKPNDQITKAQVAQVLYNMENQPEVNDKKVFAELKDVYEAEWYANAVAWTYNNGIVTGDLNSKKFNPNANVTREQLALMMYRYAQYKTYDTSAISDLNGLINAEQVADWAKDGVKWAVGAELISGLETKNGKDLAPQGNATRAQMAAILQRFSNLR